MVKIRSTYRLTVSQELYEHVCNDVGQQFADSYLFGAVEQNGRLIPRTVTGYLKMRDMGNFDRVLKDRKLEVRRPTPFPGDGSRLTHMDCFGS